MGKASQTQIKMLEADLMEVGVKPNIQNQLKSRSKAK